MPDLCALNVDVRLTPAFDAEAAETLVRKAAAQLDAELPGPLPTHIEPIATWPPFRLRHDEQPAAALMAAARRAGIDATPKTAGPSNIGNLLAVYQEFASRRVNRVNSRKEFFRVTPTEVKAVLERSAGEHLVEFNEVAEASEWRSSKTAGNGAS